MDRHALQVHPLSPDRWDDLVELFGERGAYSGCWCMWFRETGREFSRLAGAGNRRALQRLVASGNPPGLLGYLGGRAVGWCLVAPREEFGRLQRSPILKALDRRPVWSIVCLFVDRTHRGQGIAEELVRAAADYAARQGAQLVEGYPVDAPQIPAAQAFPGTVPMFARAGFEEVARRSPTRPIMRRRIGGG